MFVLLSLIAVSYVVGNDLNAVAATTHYCYLMGEMSSSQGIGQAETNAVIANLDDADALAAMGLTPKENYTESGPYMFYLTEDISWEGEISAPEGMLMVICKN